MDLSLARAARYGRAGARWARLLLPGKAKPGVRVFYGHDRVPALLVADPLEVALVEGGKLRRGQAEELGGCEAEVIHTDRPPGKPVYFVGPFSFGPPGSLPGDEPFF